MKGGRRYGAGRPAHKIQLWHRLNLDIRQLYRQGYFNSYAHHFTWSWHRHGEQTDSLSGVMLNANQLRLKYSTQNESGVWVPQTALIEIGYTQCTYGGQRPWFICPRTGRMAARVYYVRGQWLSRFAFKHAYVSQSCSPLELIERRIEKIEAKLADDMQRPKGMHHKTYGRLFYQLQAYEWAVNGLIYQRLQRWA